jgi:hypothetical protein
MTVFVDDAKIPAAVRNGSITHTSQWSHLTADTLPELHQFATALGLRRSYFQADKIHPHYDLTAGMRFKAIRMGAQEISWAESAETARRCATSEPEEAPAARVIKRNYHEDLVRGSCGHTFNRPKGETYEICLACQTAERLGKAGFTHDDPALTRIRDHNARVQHTNTPRLFHQMTAENAERSDRAAAVHGVVTR